jgi:hypothetical protein
VPIRLSCGDHGRVFICTIGIFAEALWGNHPEPIPHDLFQSFVLLLRHGAHVADRISSVNKKSSLLEQSFITYEFFKVSFPIAVIVQDTDQLT